MTPITLEPYPLPNPLGESRGSDQDLDHNRSYYAAHGRFAGQVAATINGKACFVPPASSYLVPLVDAPLFGDLDLHTQCSTLSPSTELPSRAHADRLVDIYWQYVDPAEPVLDRHQFFQYYAASFSTSDVSLRGEPHIRLSILNLVFALAVQRQECIPLDERNNEGNIYFRRAWALLPTESILWEPGSLERVQCLMLVNRYLHCTNNQQKTWMTAGLAMRIAQTMCGHTPEKPSATDVGDGARLKRKVWASCVSLDRCALRLKAVSHIGEMELTDTDASPGPSERHQHYRSFLRP